MEAATPSPPMSRTLKTRAKHEIDIFAPGLYKQVTSRPSYHESRTTTLSQMDSTAVQSLSRLKLAAADEKAPKEPLILPPGASVSMFWPNASELLCTTKAAQAVSGKGEGSYNKLGLGKRLALETTGMNRARG